MGGVVCALMFAVVFITVYRSPGAGSYFEYSSATTVSILAPIVSVTTIMISLFVGVFGKSEKKRRGFGSMNKEPMEDSERLSGRGIGSGYGSRGYGFGEF